MQDKQPVTPVTQPPTQQEAPQSARESIRAAMDEQKEKLVKAEVKEVKNQEEKKEPATPPAEEKAEKQETKPEKKEEVKEEKKEDTSDPSVQQTKKDEKVEPKDGDKPKSKVPFGIPKEIRAEWDSLSPNTQQYLSKVVKENLDTKAAEGRRTHMRDVEQVLTPYMTEIQRVGVTPAQVVKRLLDYSDALANPQQKYAAIQSLATNYGIDLSVFSSQDSPQPNSPQQNQNQNQQQQQGNEQLLSEIDNRLYPIVDKFNKLEESQRSANDKAALEYVNTWAGFNGVTNEYTSKPYFPYVRQAMFQLIASGVVPVVNGQIDLDGAYEAACYANPEIRELVEEDRNKQLELKQRADAQKQQQALQKVKAAGSSIRSGAPAPASNKIPPKTVNGRPLSARESIRMAIQEVRG